MMMIKQLASVSKQMVMMVIKQLASVCKQMMMMMMMMIMKQLASVCKQGVNWNCSYEKVACRVANSFLAEADDDEEEEEDSKSLNRTLQIFSIHHFP